MTGNWYTQPLALFYLCEQVDNLAKVEVACFTEQIPAFLTISGRIELHNLELILASYDFRRREFSKLRAESYEGSVVGIVDEDKVAELFTRLTVCRGVRTR